MQLGLQLKQELHLQNETINSLIRMYDENFSPHVRIKHKKLKKRLENTYQVFTLKTNNEKDTIGFMFVILNKPLKSIFIDYLCVDKKYQKGGFGKLLLNEMNDKHLFPDFDYTILECEGYLIPYYVKNGYKKIPLEYPIENSKPLYLMYRKRSVSNTTLQETNNISMYHKFICFGLLFNSEIIMFYIAFMIMYELTTLFYRSQITLVIMNFKSTHT